MLWGSKTREQLENLAKGEMETHKPKNPTAEQMIKHLESLFGELVVLNEKMLFFWRVASVKETLEDTFLAEENADHKVLSPVEPVVLVGFERKRLRVNPSFFIYVLHPTHGPMISNLVHAFSVELWKEPVDKWNQ